MNRRWIAGCILLTVAMASAAADDPEPQRAFEAFPSALGVFFGEASGMGLSYHRWLEAAPGSGVQIAGGGVYTPTADSGVFWGTYLDYSVGIEYQRSVYGEDFVNWLSGQLYLWAGLTHRGYIVETVLVPWEYATDGSVIVEGEYGPGPFTPTVTLGIGIGIEVILFRHFSFPVEVGYSATYSFIADTVLDGLTVKLIPQGGFRYRY